MANNPEAKITVKMFNDDFKKGAKELTKESQSISREFKLQSEQMKLTASETEKLQAKMEFLTKKHDVAKKSVQEHEKAYEQAKTMFGENSQAAEDMAKKLDNARIEEQKLANEVELTRRALQNQSSEVENTKGKFEALSEKLNDVGDKMKNAGGKMKDIGKDMSMKVTAPIVAAGGAMFKFANDQETAFAQVKTLLEGSAEDFDQYKKTIREYSSELGVSFEDYAEAVYSSISAGQDQADAIEFTAKAVKLAGGGFTETSKAVDVMTTALNAYKLESSEAEKISDMLITTQNLGKTTVDALSASMGAVIPVAQAQGVGFEQLAAGYAVLTKNGIDTAQAGTYMKAMFGELGKAGSKVDKILRKQTGKSFSELQAEGKTTGDVLAVLQGQADKSGLKLSDMFGSVQAGSAALVLATNDGAEFKDFLGEMQNSAGATEKAFNIMADTTSDKMQIAWTTIKNVLAEFGEVMLPIVAEVAGKIGELASKFSGLDPALQQFILVIGGVVAAIGPVLVIIGTLVAALGGVLTALGTFSGAMAVITTGAAAATPAVGTLAAVITALTGPVAIAVAAIIGIGAALVLAYNKVEWFRDGVNKVWEAIKSATKVAFDAVSKVITSIVKDVVEFSSRQLDKFKAFWEENGQFITEIVKKYFGYIADNIKLVMGIIKGIFEVFWPILSGIVKVVWENIKLIVGTAIDLVLGTIQTVMKLLQGDWEGAWETIKGTAVKIVGNIVKFFKDVDLLQIGKDIIQGLINGIASMADAVVERVKSLADSIPNWIKKVLGIQSPSKVLKEQGVFIGQGLAIGVDSTRAANEKAVLGVAKVLSDTARKNAAEVTAISVEAEKSRIAIQNEYAKKRADLNSKTAQSSQSALKTHKNKKGQIVKTGEDKVYQIRKNASASLIKLNEEEQKKINSINEKARADMVKKENQLAKERLEALKSYVDDKKSLNELSLVAEAEVWRKSLSLFKEGTKERIEVQKGYQSALKAVNAEIEAINKEHADKVNSIIENTNKAIQAQNEIYSNAFSKRVGELTNFAGMFDEFVVKMDKSGQDLINNLVSQVAGLAEWRAHMDSLWERTGDQTFMEELEAMGPKALGEIRALTSMSDTELESFVNLYNAKFNLARERATQELAGLKADTEDRIRELKESANTELDIVRKEWVKKIASITKATDDELKSLKQIGVNAGQGLLNGLASMEGALVAKARSIASAVSAAMATALQVKSPSRVTMAIGEHVGEGLMVGMENMLNDIKRVAVRMGELAVPNMPNIHADVVSEGLSRSSGYVAGGDTYHIENVTIDGRTIEVMQHAGDFFTRIKQEIKSN